MKLLFSLLLLLTPLGCAGRVVAAGDGGSHGDAGSGGPDDAARATDTRALDVGVFQEASIDAGVDCGQPSQTVYTCPADSGADAAFCHRYGGPHDSASTDAGFAQGCTVTLPSCGFGFGGAQTCNCGPFPGGTSPQWVCPI
jgi:hypothetical protein